MSPPGEILGGPTGFVHARLPIVHELEHEACCTLKAYHYRPIERMEFHRAAAVAGVGDDLSERFEKLYENIFQASSYAENAHQTEHMGWLESLVPVLGGLAHCVEDFEAGTARRRLVRRRPPDCGRSRS